MAVKLAKTLSAVLIGMVLMNPASADVQDNLPDIGTTAGGTLSINQELAMGDFYVRQLRAGAPLIYDPLLVNYVNTLGQKLVSQADSVKTPFEFYLIRNNQINAFAFFGGNVVLHTALFRETDNESQLASVMAHEIAHVTQRHLARAMEEQNRNAPLTWVGAFGSILLAMANPEAGMAALSTTMAGAQQSMISFTQSNEQEADRIGIRTLARAGFEPQAMPEFMLKLADQYRYASKPPEMLLTHPLPDSRVTDSRNRAGQMKQPKVASSQDYLLAKVRVFVMFDRSSNAQSLRQNLFLQLASGNSYEKIAARYGRALQFYQERKFDEATKQLQPLLAQQPNNAWFLDLMTDIDLEQGNYAQAVSRLEKALATQPKNLILQINLANAYIEAKQPEKASTLLNRYTFNNPGDVNGWELLSKASADRGLRDEELAARAESLALAGQLDQAINMLVSASGSAKVGSLQQARYDARIDQLRQLQKRFRQYQKAS